MLRKRGKHSCAFPLIAYSSLWRVFLLAVKEHGSPALRAATGPLKVPGRRVGVRGGLRSVARGLAATRSVAPAGAAQA